MTTGTLTPDCASGSGNAANSLIRQALGLAAGSWERRQSKSSAVAAPLDILLLLISALIRFLIGVVALTQVYNSTSLALSTIVAIAALFSSAFTLMDARLMCAFARVRALRIARERGLPLPDKTIRLRGGGVLKRIALSLVVMSFASVLFELAVFQPDIRREIDRRFNEENQLLFETVGAFLPSADRVEGGRRATASNGRRAA